MHNSYRNRPVFLGVYRVPRGNQSDLARIRWEAGDAAPFVSREIYEALHLQPHFDSLPTLDDYVRRQEIDQAAFMPIFFPQDEIGQAGGTEAD